MANIYQLTWEDYAIKVTSLPYPIPIEKQCALSSKIVCLQLVTEGTCSVSLSLSLFFIPPPLLPPSMLFDLSSGISAHTGNKPVIFRLSDLVPLSGHSFCLNVDN